MWDSAQEEPPAGWPVVEIEPGKGAQAEFQWFNWCLSQPPARWEIAIDGSRFTAPSPRLTARCDGTPGSASSMDLGPVEILRESASAKDPLFAYIDAPQTARAGATLRYTVELTNYGNSPVSLSSCPVYRERLTTAATQRFAINCGAMTAIPARTSVVFAMELPIPASVKHGSYELQWKLQGPPSSNGAWAYVEISG